MNEIESVIIQNAQV